jgi:zinc transport system substrate-binding protein
MKAVRAGVAAFAATLLLPPLLAGCSGAGAAGHDAGLHVVAAFYPFAYVAERDGGDHAEVTNLTSPGLEPHDIELTPQQVAEISQADIVVYEKGFQPSVDAAVEQNPARQNLDVTTVVPLQDTGSPAQPDTGGGPDVTATDQLEGDPHLWLNPTLLIPIAHKLAAELAAADPPNASDYRRNAARLATDLRSLDAEFRRGLADCRRTVFVTSHAAFGYLAQRYGLTMIPIAGLSPDAEPSPQHLAELQDLIRHEGVTTVFSEVLGSKKYADTMAGDLGITTAVLDPIEGLADSGTGQDYLSLMRANLSALRQANGCS